jgi:hypothetical protein
MTAELLIVGKRHKRSDGRECLCGCHWVVGAEGHIVQDADTAKLAALEPPILYAAFDVPYHPGQVVVAYSYAELGLEP